MSVDVIEILQKQIHILQVSEDLKEDTDVAKYIEAFDIIVDYIDNIDNANGMYKKILTCQKSAVYSQTEIIYILKNGYNWEQQIFISFFLIFVLDFHKIGGFTIFNPCLKCDNPEIRAAACNLLAELCQNNPYCQRIVLDNALMPVLVKLLDVDESDEVNVKALYAISCKYHNLTYFFKEYNSC